MSEKDAESKVSFVERVDCNFPHWDERAALALVAEAEAEHEPHDALFALLYEIANPPYSVPKGGTGARAALQRITEVLVDDPFQALTSMVLERLGGRRQEPTPLLALMDSITGVTRSTVPLAVVASLVDVDLDPSDSVERRYNEILNASNTY